MKFGSEMNDRSIERWKNYNIDYNLLKRKIKLATTDYPQSNRSVSSDNTGSVSASGSGTYTASSVSTKDTLGLSETTLLPPLSTAVQHHLQKRQKKGLKQLYAAFMEQIQFVSLFVNSKYGEISRRIMATKQQLNAFINAETDSSAEVGGDMIRRMRARKFLNIHRELEAISTDLQDLSRFILLQKIAIKKLFKKFLKHSTYAYKQELVDKINAEFLTGRPDSFVNLDLSDAAMELTLMFDVINNYYYNDSAPQITTEGQPGSVLSTSPSSLLSVDYLRLPDSQSKLHSDLFSSKVTAFDILSQKKAPISQIFWVHKDNLDETRFLLLREFKLISDDTGIIDEYASEEQAAVANQANRGGMQLKKTESSMNLALKSKVDARSMARSSSGRLQQQGQRQSDPKPQPQQPNDDDLGTFHAETEVVSCWLANPTKPMMTSSRATGGKKDEEAVESGPGGSVDTARRGDVYPCDVVPQVTYSDYAAQQVPLMMAPVGGLRQFTLTAINSEMLQDLFEKNLDKSQFVSKWQQSGLVGNPKMAQITLDWCHDKKLAPLAKVRADRIRFIELGENQKKIECFITLNSNIKTCKTLKPDWEHLWTDADEELSDTFPHSILEIRYDSPLKTLPSNVQSLIDSHLVYRVDNLEFSLNNYLFGRYYPDCVPDSLMLEFIAPWYEDLVNKDIRKLPSLHRESTRSFSDRSTHGILLNKNDVQPPQSHRQGYWNEFDYGSDFENDDAFYVYQGSDDSTDDYHNINLFGFNLLTPEKIENILEFGNSISTALRKLKFFGNDSHHGAHDLESRSLMANQHNEAHSYHSVSGSSSQESNSGSDSEADFFVSQKDRERQRRESIIENAVGTNAGAGTSSGFRPNELARQVTHDRVLAGLYFSVVLISYLVDGVGIGIFYSIIHGSVREPGMVDKNGFIMLLVFGFLCMSVALVLAVGSICLLMCRYANAPQWHYFVVWFSFLLITTILILCLTSLF
ncbi:DEKNAAC104590 [Brettanomyces naardenensis]|uniref:DEKNAAC104590 n=1 Tax=Brettanomyces naardenensis TaxID=13370 RepID=A0A448YR85_BRENA|nr:DEKNAAC104590 [Brettanomyces naardenensis]